MEVIEGLFSERGNDRVPAALEEVMLDYFWVNRTGNYGNYIAGI